MKTLSLSLSLSLLLASTLIVASTPASAAYSREVKFKLNVRELASTESRQALLKRMKSEVRTECSGGISGNISAQSCRTDLERQLIAKIGNAALMAQYDGKTVQVARN